jgi:UDP-N-acetylmuramoyl-tripeptide--D-alanyl-D-alanine ligase
VGVITNIGPVHLELVGTVENVAQAKAELIAELAPGAACVVPAGEEALAPHLRTDVRFVTFAGRPDQTDADVRALAIEHAGDGVRVEVAAGVERAALGFNFFQAHNVTNALAAIGVLHALGVPLNALGEGAGSVRFSSLRGEELVLRDGIVIINDCYNANPVSMRAALDHLAAVADRRGARRVVAVLGDMRELGPGAPEFHREVGSLAAEAGVEVLLAVGEHAADYVRGFGGPAHEAPDAERAAELAADLVREGDVVLVKASRGVGLERVTGTLEGARGAHA